jgi:SAM-dependent methyltransferase
MMTIDYYTRYAAKYCRETVGLKLTHLYKPFLAYIPNGGKILDAGCGSGRDSLHFKRLGYLVTAFDACEALVNYSSKLLSQPVFHLTFQQLSFRDEFDGVWACASLIHVSREEMGSVMKRLSSTLKRNGVMYASFKVGVGEGLAGGRLFNNFDESGFSDLLSQHPSLSLIRCWRTQDVRDNRRNEMWLNALVKKVSDEKNLHNV